MASQEKELTQKANQGLACRVTGQTRGRALYIGRQGEVYIAKRYAIYRSDDWGATWRLDCFVPSWGWKPLLARTHLGYRLLRFYIAAFRALADGSRMAVARDGIYRAGAGEGRMSRVFRVTRGSRPLNLAVDGPRVLFGEYGRDLSAVAVRIYVSEDFGKTFQVGFQFPRGDVFHVHNILVDPHENGYWVLVGEHGRQPGIGLLSKDLRTLDWLTRGSQRSRAVAALVEPDCLLYGTDSNHDRNFIVRLDKQSGKTAELLELEGSSFYATNFGPVRVISTGVEPNPACSSRQCSLYASRDGTAWQRFAVHLKDKYDAVYFHIGTLVLPYAYHADPRGMFSGQAVVGADDEVSFVEFS
jgi:hypothetical protein